LSCSLTYSSAAKKSQHAVAVSTKERPAHIPSSNRGRAKLPTKMRRRWRRQPRPSNLQLPLKLSETRTKSPMTCPLRASSIKIQVLLHIRIPSTKDPRLRMNHRRARYPTTLSQRTESITAACTVIPDVLRSLIHYHLKPLSRRGQLVLEWITASMDQPTMISTFHNRHPSLTIHFPSQI